MICNFVLAKAYRSFHVISHAWLGSICSMVFCYFPTVPYARITSTITSRNHLTNRLWWDANQNLIVKSSHNLGRLDFGPLFGTISRACLCCWVSSIVSFHTLVFCDPIVKQWSLICQLFTEFETVETLHYLLNISSPQHVSQNCIPVNLFSIYWLQ